MNRNAIMRAVSNTRDSILPVAVTVNQNALIGELERFGNDLCHVPCEHNRDRKGVRVYTLKQARIEYAKLVRCVDSMFQKSPEAIR